MSPISKHKIQFKGTHRGICHACGHYTEVTYHHMIFGANRRVWSDCYGLVRDLCSSCHDRVHRDHMMELNYRKIAQKQFEDKYGHDKYMQIFGRNYL